MAITRTPIIDDDGTGTTGTVIDNAWKTELYNQIDASVAGVAALGSASGVDTVAGPTSFSFFAIPQLTLADALQISVLATNAASGPIALNLAWYDPATAAVIPAIVLTGPTGAGTFAASNVLMVQAQARPLPPGPANMRTTAASTLTAGTVQAAGGVMFGGLSTANFLSAGGGYLYFRHDGVPAGGLLYWSWSVHLLKG